MSKEEYRKYLSALNDSEFIDEVKSFVIKSHFDLSYPKWKAEIFRDFEENKKNLIDIAIHETYAYIDLLESDIFRKKFNIPRRFDEIDEQERIWIKSLSSRLSYHSAEFPDTGKSLNEILNIGNQNLLLAKISGNSMIDANLCENDIIIIDTSSRTKDGDIVLILLDDEYIVKRLKIIDNKIFFYSENADIPPFKAELSSDFKMIGVVKYYIKSAS